MINTCKNILKAAALCAVLSLSFNTGIMAASNVAAEHALADYKPKKLQAEQIKLLSAVLTAAPIAMVRMHLANLASKRIVKSLGDPAFILSPTAISAEGEKKEVHEHLKKVLAPVKEFLTEVKNYASMIKPLIMESLGEGAADSLFIKSFETPSVKGVNGIDNSVEDFFLANVSTRRDLCLVCQQFNKFFSDLHHSFSPEAISAFNELWSKIKGNASQHRS